MLVSRSSRPTTNAVCWLGGKVRPALMSGKRFVSLTDEVPRSSSFRSIIWTYQALPKGFTHAPAAGTMVSWPRSQGCLQRQSTASLHDAGKAKPQSDSSALASSREQLASAKKHSLRLLIHCEQLRLGRTLLAPRRRFPILGVRLCPSRQHALSVHVGVA